MNTKKKKKKEKRAKNVKDCDVIFVYLRKTQLFVCDIINTRVFFLLQMTGSLYHCEIWIVMHFYLKLAPGLVPVKVKGESIFKGRKVTAFTNAEEDAVQLSKVMPFMLESRVKELGGQFSAADEIWKAYTVVG